MFPRLGHHRVPLAGESIPIAGPPEARRPTENPEGPENIMAMRIVPLLSRRRITSPDRDTELSHQSIGMDEHRRTSILAHERRSAIRTCCFPGDKANPPA